MRPADFDREAEEARLEEDELDEGVVYDVDPYEPDESLHLSSSAFAISPDGSRLLARETPDREDLGLRTATGLLIWDTADPSTPERLVVGTGDATWLADGQHLAVTTRVGVDVVDPSGKPVQHLMGHWPNRPAARMRSLVLAVHHLAGPSLLLTYGSDRTLRLWDVDSAGCSPGESLEFSDISPYGHSVSLTGEQACVAGQHREGILRFDLEQAERLDPIDTGDDHFSTPAFDADGTLVWSRSGEKDIDVLTADGTRSMAPFTKGWEPGSLTGSSDGRMAVHSNRGDAVGLWDRETGEVQELAGGPTDVERLLWSPDGTVLYALSPTAGVHAWDGSAWQAFGLAE